MKVLLEESLLNELDVLLLEDYPSMFLQLKKPSRDFISKRYAVGPNSKQEKIDKSQIKDHPKELILVTDDEYSPVGMILGSYGILFKTSGGDYAKSLEDEEDSENNNRDRLVKLGKYFYRITSDPEGWKEIQRREQRGEYEKPEYDVKKKTYTGPKGFNITKKGLEQEFETRINKYIKTRIGTLISLMPQIKNILNEELKKSKDKFIESYKTNHKLHKSYRITDKYKKIISSIYNILDYIKTFERNPESYKDEQYIKSSLKDIGKKWNTLLDLLNISKDDKTKHPTLPYSFLTKDLYKKPLEFPSTEKTPKKPRAKKKAQV
jgi:hypothetical protein